MKYFKVYSTRNMFVQDNSQTEKDFVYVSDDVHLNKK